jgi:hypothetical protein
MPTKKDAPTARADYLAANPKAKQLQTVQLKEITKRIGTYRKKMLARAKDWIDAANEAREIGVLIIDFLDSIPGKQLTIDFWKQMESLFVDQHGSPITQDQLKWFVKVASANPEPIKEVLVALQYRQPLLLAAGNKEILELESERSPQTLHAPSNPLAELKELLDYSEFQETIKRFKSDPNYFPNGKIRDDLREPLLAELEPTFRLVDEIRRELGA